MQRIKQKPKSNEFETGDKVRINAMFFRNHGLKIMEIIGEVKGTVPMWESKIPAIRVAFPYNPTFNQWSNNGYVKYNLLKGDDGFLALMRIHPMYLEKVK